MMTDKNKNNAKDAKKTSFCFVFCVDFKGFKEVRKVRQGKFTKYLQIENYQMSHDQSEGVEIVSDSS